MEFIHIAHLFVVEFIHIAHLFVVEFIRIAHLFVVEFVLLDNSLSLWEAKIFTSPSSSPVAEFVLLAHLFMVEFVPTPCPTFAVEFIPIAHLFVVEFIRIAHLFVVEFVLLGNSLSLLEAVGGQDLHQSLLISFLWVHFFYYHPPL